MPKSSCPMVDGKFQSACITHHYISTEILTISDLTKSKFKFKFNEIETLFSHFRKKTCISLLEIGSRQEIFPLKFDLDVQARAYFFICSITFRPWKNGYMQRKTKFKVVIFCRHQKHDLDFHIVLKCVPMKENYRYAADAEKTLSLQAGWF